MELSRRKIDGAIPMGMLPISETGTDLWGMSVKVNKRVWRGLSFTQQRAIIGAVSELQDILDEIISVKYSDLLAAIELGGKDDDSFNQEKETTTTEPTTKQHK